MAFYKLTKGLSHPLSYLIQNKRKRKNIFLVMINLRIYSLSLHIQHTAVLIILIMLYITSLVLIYFINGSLYF